MKDFQPLMSSLKDGGCKNILANAHINEFNAVPGKIIYALWQKDNISIELSKLVALANTTLTSMFDIIKQADMIKWHSAPYARQRNLIALIDKANSLREKYEQVLHKMSEAYYNDFVEKEIADFKRYLQSVPKNVK